MQRRELLRRSFLAAGGGLTAPMLNIGNCRLSAASTRRYSVRIIDLVNSSIVVDMLGLLTLDWQLLRRWLEDPKCCTSNDLADLRKSQISVLHPAVNLVTEHPREATIVWLEKWNRFLAAHPDAFAAVSTCADFARAKNEGRTGILLGMQNSAHFESTADVAYFKGLGQRLSQLTYNGPNQLGCGCLASSDRGLTPFGVSIVQAMNKAGMIVDVSHAGERTTLDAFEASSRPVLITHSNCKALVRHPRCKSDAVIRGMARGGGVLGITGIRAYVRRPDYATVEDALNHFDHVARLVGVEHVGIGSDLDLSGRPGLGIRRLSEPNRVFDIAEGLVRRGYSDADIRLVLGGNFKRAVARISVPAS